MPISDPPSWPPPKSWTREALRESDKETIDERIERHTYLASLFLLSDGMLILGGTVAWLALEDAQRSFLAGNFLAVVLCAQSFAEHSLANHYIMSGDDKTAESGFFSLINKSKSDGLLDTKSADQLHELRKMRNPYVHPRAGAGPRTYMERLLNSGHNHPYNLVESDAKFALAIMAEFIGEPPPI